MSDTNPDLAAQEVDEELRRDQLRALWQAYGKFIIGGAVGIVLAVGGYQLSEYLTKSAQEKSSGIFAEALDSSSDKVGAEAAAVWEDAAANLDGGYAAMAHIRAAQALAAEGKAAEAIAAYDVVAQNTAFDVVLRDYAGFSAALLVLDTGDLAGARGRLVTLSVEGSPWKYSAKEQLAYIDLKEGRLAEALEQFSLLAADSAAPQTVAARAQQFRDMIERKLPADVADGVEDTDEAGESNDQ